MRSRSSKSPYGGEHCTEIIDPVVRHLCEWCQLRQISTDQHDSVSFWMNFEVPIIDRRIPIKIRRDGKYVKYRFDYNQIYPPVGNNDPKVEEYIEALEYLLDDVLADPLWRFTLIEVGDKKIARGRCWIEAREDNLRENEIPLLLAMRHAILLISKADGFFNADRNGNEV